MTSPTIIIGSFYEDGDGNVLRPHGWNGDEKTVSYSYDDDHGARQATEVEFAAFRHRPDLVDFPHARDPRLPYVFDLFWDVKHLSQLQGLLDSGVDTSEVLAAINEHGIELPAMPKPR